MAYTNRRRSGNSGWKRKIKEYIVPIVGVLLVLILLFFLFRGGNDPEATRDTENQKGFNVYLDSESSQATLVYPGDYKADIEGDSLLYKGEKIIVKEGNVSVIDGSNFDFKINKLGELKYLENGNFEVTSGEVWLNNYISMTVNMNFASLTIDAKSHLSLSQNEMGSTIYLISGFVEIANLGGKSTVLAPGEKITIARGDASKTDIDLSLLKENIDQFFIKSDWYILNKGASFVGLDSDENPEGEGTSSSSSGGGNVSGNGIISFNNLIDGSNVSSSTIAISGTYYNDEVEKISVNGKEAVIDKDSKTFRIDNVSVGNYENDLVFKVLDASNEELTKFVYTIYYNGGTVTNNTSSSSGGGFNVQTYNVDGSQFTFTSPTTTNTYTTNETFITIRGKVLASGIDSVTINDYKLTSYEVAGGTWRYHASTSNNNLADGTNVYEIKYYSGGNVVYTNYFTIIKKDEIPATTNNNTETNSNPNSNSQAENNLF